MRWIIGALFVFLVGCNACQTEARITSRLEQRPDTTNPQACGADRPKGTFRLDCHQCRCVGPELYCSTEKCE